MRKRNVRIQFWLDKKESEALDKKVKRSGLSREAYLRHLVNGLVPKEAPPPDYFTMMRELHGIGNNLNQIAQKAHVLQVVDAQRYDEAVRRFEQAVKKITEAVILPRPIEAPRKAGFAESPFLPPVNRILSARFLYRLKGQTAQILHSF